MKIYIDLSKGKQPVTNRRLDRSKLIKRPVQVKGKDGKIFTRMQWVDPKTGQPVSEGNTRESIDGMNPTAGNPGKTQKEFIDHHVKNTLSKQQKDRMLKDHDIQWEKHENPQKDRINAIQALKEHLYKNPHLAGAEHLPKDNPNTDPATGKDAVNAFTDRFKTNPELLYKMMKELGINEGIDPRTVSQWKKKPEGDGTGDIKHMNFMMKLKKHLMDHPSIMNEDKWQVPGNNPNNQGTPTPTAPAISKTSSKPSKAEQGGNTIKGILSSMPSAELYNMMKQHGICPDGVDPRTVPEWAPKNNGGDGTGAIKHMNYMMKLRKLIEMDPHILNLNENGDLSKTEKERLDDMDGEQKLTQRVSDFVGGMSKDLKESFLYKYRKEDIIKDRKRYDDDNIDYMHGVTALKSLYRQKPQLMDDDTPEVEREHLMNMKIGNKLMAKILRGVCGLKGVGDVTINEKGEEWSWSMGFVRRQLDDNDEPILSVVQDQDKEGNEMWEEYVFPMSDVKKFIDNLKSGNSEEAAKVAESIKPQEIPLYKKPLPDIYQALHEDFSANYTPEVGEALKPVMRTLSRAHMATNPSPQDSNRISSMSKSMSGLTPQDLAKVLNKMGVKVSPDGTRFDMHSDPWKEIAYGDMVTSQKEKNVMDYLIPKNDHLSGETAGYDTWALHKSARQWTPEERVNARKEFLHNLTNVQDSEAIPDFDKRKSSIVNHIHQSLVHVPFDLLTDTLSNGMKINFAHSKGDKPLVGAHLDTTNGQIYLDHHYVTHDAVFADHAMGNKNASVPHPTQENATYRLHPISDTMSHEFAHGIDYYLSNNNRVMGNWDNPKGDKYAGKYKNVTRESYAKKVAKSNPKAEIGLAMQNGKFVTYHKDEWISWYEGRLYDQRFSGDVKRNPNIEVAKNYRLYDKQWHNVDARKDVAYAEEHWSENSARYANAVHSYQKWRDDNPDQSSVGIDSWAKMMHDKFVSMGYHTDPDYNDSVSNANNGYKGNTSYRNGLRDHPIEGYGFLWHKVNQLYPHMVKGLKHIYDRPDFVDDKSSMGRIGLSEQGDYARKSVSEGLLIYLD